MVTDSVDVRPDPPRHRNRFFVWIGVAMMTVVALGFGKSFYLRPAFNSGPLPVYLVVHGIVMTLWYILFLVQALLVNARRTNMHRKLGVIGVLLAAGVAVTGAMVHLNRIPRLQALELIDSPETMQFVAAESIAGLSFLVPFTVLVVLAVAMRRNREAHKRLMFWTFVWTIGPALTGNRPLGAFLDPLVAPYLPFFPADLFWFAALLIHDWGTLRRIHPATWLTFLALAFYFLGVEGWIADMEPLQQWLLRAVGA